MMTPNPSRMMCRCGAYYLLPATCCGFCELEAEKQLRLEREYSEQLERRRETNRMAKQSLRSRLEISREKSRLYYERHKEEICRKQREKRANGRG